MNFTSFSCGSFFQFTEEEKNRHFPRCFVAYSMDSRLIRECARLIDLIILAESSAVEQKSEPLGMLHTGSSAPQQWYWDSSTSSLECTFMRRSLQRV